MTPSDLAEYARQQYNSLTDDFFSESELNRHIWAAQLELARKAFLIERVYTTTTVADQREYEFPTNTIGIKRVEYEGVKLAPINFREDDAITLNNSATTGTGTPACYAVWNRTLYLRPVPIEAGELTIFSYSEPQAVDTTSTLEVPTAYHLDMANYLLWRKSIKDQNFEAARHYKETWDECVKAAREFQRKSKRGDSFATVQDIDMLNSNGLGGV
jgi:hypothetical protein